MRHQLVFAFLALLIIWPHSPAQAQDEVLSSLGWLTPYITAAPPDGCLPADGSSYLREDYPDLYAALDSAFIVDADNFTTPDLRGRAAIGAGEGNDLTERFVGEDGGEETHQLTASEMPSHSHSVIDPGHTHTLTNSRVFGPGGGTFAPYSGAYTWIFEPQTSSATTGITLGSAGSDGAHNNMMPFLAVNWCVVALELPTGSGGEVGATIVQSEMGDGQTVAFDYTVTAGDVGVVTVLGFTAMFTGLSFLRRQPT